MFQACLESIDATEPNTTSAFTAFDATLIVDDEDDDPITSSNDADEEPIF